MNNSWFIIANPSSGNKDFSKKWEEITKYLKYYGINYQYAFTKKHSREISKVKKAIKKGFKNIISVGGDGTLHNVVNGVMLQEYIKPSEINIAVIPLGTGNDWIKTYNISKNIKQAIELLVNKKTIRQDIGCLHLKHKKIYFNNSAGIGFDAYVVKNLVHLKFLGSLSYLITSTLSFLNYKKDIFTIKANNKQIKTKCLITVFGICKYSGGGMQFTNHTNFNNGKLNISVAKNFNFLDMILNTFSLYNNKIINHKKIETFETEKITVIPSNKKRIYIQADGELLGKGEITVTIIKKAINFIIP
ncbi:MAG: diacylglycerol kinase family lipid kinase [Tenacibaculum sp.]|nr:diacylglycerol kinase family lipid kinase [Tenacibaculum sp.]